MAFSKHPDDCIPGEINHNENTFDKNKDETKIAGEKKEHQGDHHAPTTPQFRGNKTTDLPAPQDADGRESGAAQNK
jgi:hypothetical protein